MRIAYCTNVRLPSERAHGHQVAQVCAALATLGHSVTVFVPFRRNIVLQDFHTYYQADPAIHIRHLGSFDPINSRLLPGVFGLWMLNFWLRANLKKELKNFDLLYTRSPALLSALLSTSMPVIVELHQLPRRSRRAFVRQCNRCAVVVCLTSPMRDQLKAWGVDEAKMIVAGDAVDLRRFASVPSRDDARKKFAITTNRPLVGYVGRLTTLNQDKGVTDLLKAAAALKTSHPIFLFLVGGPEADAARYAAMATSLGLGVEDVRFTGDIPPSDVSAALAACDILAMPFPDLPHYRTNMLPLKMFEYMAANRPIVTSDLPTIRDVLSEETAFFCTPGDSADLARVITSVIQNSTEAQKRATNARTLVEDHTWQKRMSRILLYARL